jgi:PD-(D/E)XK nuclease superfamily
MRHRGTEAQRNTTTSLATSFNAPSLSIERWDQACWNKHTKGRCVSSLTTKACDTSGRGVVEDLVVVEIKSVERTAPLFEAQILNYVRVSRKRAGLLMNFNSHLMKDGIDRSVL